MVGSSKLYGVSFVFHESQNTITSDIIFLNEKLKNIGYRGMIHTANLITKREEYASYDIRKRAEIFNALYQFARKIPAKYHSIIIDKKYHNTKNQLRKHLYREMEELIYKNKSYLIKPNLKQL